MDAPGVAVRVADPDGEDAHQLVHWEMISQVVVTRQAGRSGPGEPGIETIALRLRADPGGVVHRQPVAGWGYEREALANAVGRFAGDAVTVGEETPSPYGSPVYAATPVRTRPGREAWLVGGAVGVGGAFEVLTSDLPLTGFVLPLFLVAPFLVFARVVRRRTVAPLLVTADGVLFGPGPGSLPATAWHVWWRDIEAVVLFILEGDPQQRPVVGVRTRPAAPGRPARITTYRIADGWRLDRVMLQSVVQAHRPNVPILDLGPVSPVVLG